MTASPMAIPVLAQWLASATPPAPIFRADTITHGPMFTRAPTSTNGMPLNVTSNMGQKKERHTGASEIATP